VIESVQLGHGRRPAGAGDHRTHLVALTEHGRAAGEYGLLHQFAQVILRRVPRSDPDAGTGTAAARAEQAVQLERSFD
jgi:hypothetical protein